MTSDLSLPQVPGAKPEDSEDVSWALSTAEAVWTRGDHIDGIKWVRRAAEAASEAEHDHRALELAKAAADLTSFVERQTSQAPIEIEEVEPVSEVSPPQGLPPYPALKPGLAVPAVKPAAVPATVVTASRPPAPLPRPLPPMTATRKPVSNRSGTTKTSRKSRDNLDAEARAATHSAGTPPQPAGDAHPSADNVLGDASDRPTISQVNGVVTSARHGAAEWDPSPTHEITGEDPWETTDERLTVVGAPLPGPSQPSKAAQSFPRPGGKPIPPAAPAAILSTTGATAPLGPVEGSMIAHGAMTSMGAVDRSALGEPHDTGIQTSQAIRVVVWRDVNGVHVAPAGTVVSAITVDAMLVALEPKANLTAWLSLRTHRDSGRDKNRR